MAKIIDGKALAQQLTTQMAQQVAQLKAQNITPGLAVIMVGEDDASNIYVRNKHRRADKIGLHSVVIRLPESATQSDLLTQIEALNQDETIDGILVQLPLPKQIDEDVVLNAIEPHKDVDGFHPINVGHLWDGQPEIVPSTPFGVMQMLQHYGIDPAGKHAVIVGRSAIVGRPMAAMLLNADATVTIVHSKTKNMQALTKQADILVVGVGKSKFIKAEDIKPGAVVIDIGMNRDEHNQLSGDVDFDSVAPIASWITPVPGGVGPMTITMLMDQTIRIAQRRALHGNS